jgi:isoleucyl-tRNA synthetase
MYDFFTLYADVDKWDSGLKTGELPQDPSLELTNPLDKWIVSRVHQLNQEIDGHMQRYDMPNALKPILPFLDDASNWYVRRSRKRFWKSEDDSDKNDAYRTLHYVLVQLSMIMAPFTPFLAEELYQKLTGGESVHLLDWPEVGHINELVLRDMAELREGITVALAQRAANGIKVRQPLKHLMFTPTNAFLPAHEPMFIETLKEEVNVKEVMLGQSHGHDHTVTLDTKITPELKREGLMREIIRNVQQSRKQAGLEVDDRITLHLSAESKDLQAVLADKDLLAAIKAETLTSELSVKLDDAFTSEVKVEGDPLTISLAKAK